MPRVNIQLFYGSDDPIAGIMLCDHSDEYYSFAFDDWRCAVHFMRWCSKMQDNSYSPTMTYKEYNKWNEIYNYDEEFVGDFNENNDLHENVSIYVFHILLDNTMDLNKKNFHLELIKMQEERDDSSSIQSELNRCDSDDDEEQ